LLPDPVGFGNDPLTLFGVWSLFIPRH
jgi:hypothetical protein